MNKQYKTQCPHCETQFSITQEHLDQANGLVRCGSCLKPFQALDHLVGQAAPTPTKPATRTKPVAASAPKKKTADPTDESWAEQLLAEEAEEEPADAPPPQKKRSTGSRWQMPEEPLEHLNHIEDDDELSLGDEIEVSDELEGIEAGGFTDFNPDDFSNAKGAGRSNQHVDDDEDWAKALLEQAEEQEEEAPKAPKKAKETTKPKKTHNKPPSKKRPSAPSSLFDFNEDDFGIVTLGQDVPASSPSSSKPHDSTSYFIKWTSLSLLLVFIFVAQYMVFNFNQLARSSAWRPFYKQACLLLQCELPSSSDINKLQATNLLVRTVSNQEGVLLVDLLLHNQADFAQPFPRLKLRFRNMDNKLLAAGIFSPSNYLQDSMKGMKTLPAHSRVHLSFRITDPGAHAKNYALTLLPPDHA